MSGPVTMLEIEKGRLYAVSGTVPTGSGVSWIPPHLTGHMPVSCYVLMDAGHALLIDTGLPVHREAIGVALGGIMKQATRRDMIMTRREPDNIINLPPFIPRLQLETIYCGGIIDPLDFFDKMDEANTAAHIEATSQKRPSWVVPGACVKTGGLSVEVLRAEIRVLVTTYLYEETTQTLFGADSWGLVTQPSPQGLSIVRNFDERMTAPEIVKHLQDKFEWMRGAKLDVVKANVASVMKGRRIKRMCPTFGCIIEGEDTIHHLLDETIKALEILESYPPFDRLRGFNEAVFREGLAKPAVV